MKKIYLLMALWLSINPVLLATHIVGGEFQLRHLNGFNYNLTLNLYFDDINGNPEAEDPEAVVHIFSRRDNTLLQTVTLPKGGDQNVNFSNPTCTSSQVQTRLIIYASQIFLSPDVYNEAEGYYIVWERCCRNNAINNIVAPGDVGMSFYLEFPAVIKDGTPQINSSPAFQIPKGDYLCLNEPYEISFEATDSDGDSLRYSLVTPLAGNSAPFQGSIIPPPFPGPYQPVSWLAGFDENTAIPNDSALPEGAFQINQNGLIQVTPNQTGLFVFAVLCEEFRDGIKVGEVRRDFQLFVIDCPTNEAPSGDIVFGGGENALIYQPEEVLEVFSGSGNSCFSFWVKDPDPNERLNISLVPKNFTPRQAFLSASQVITQGPGDSVLVEFCWPSCLLSETDANGDLIPFEFDLVVSDDRCPAPGNDTLSVQLVSIADNNAAPFVSTNANTDPNQVYDYQVIRTVLQPFFFDVIARDPDENFMELFAVGRGFNLEDFGMQFLNVSGQSILTSRFVWETNCDFVLEEENRFLIDFIVIDQGTCTNRTDTVTVELILNDAEIFLDEFEPANAFSPNGDGSNDTFSMPDLPANNCRFQFENIEIYNRWGNQVFTSDQRDFAWDGGGLPSGVYFYFLNFKGQTYKGNVTLFK